VLDQAGFYGIVEHIPDDSAKLLLIPNLMIVALLFPKRARSSE